MSDGLGFAAAPQLQPSRTASPASPVTSSAGSSGAVSLTTNQTAAIPEAQGKQRHHDGGSSNVSTAASTPVSVASAARSPEVEASEASLKMLCEQRQQLIERGGRQFTEITHVFREGKCPAGFNPGDEFGVKQYVNIFTEEELRSFENRVDDMIADDEPWLANTLDVNPPDAIGAMLPSLRRAYPQRPQLRRPLLIVRVRAMCSSILAFATRCDASTRYSEGV